MSNTVKKSEHRPLLTLLLIYIYLQRSMVKNIKIKDSNRGILVFLEPFNIPYHVINPKVYHICCVLI